MSLYYIGNDVALAGITEALVYDSDKYTLRMYSRMELNALARKDKVLGVYDSSGNGWYCASMGVYNGRINIVNSDVIWLYSGFRYECYFPDNTRYTFTMSDIAYVNWSCVMLLYAGGKSVWLVKEDWSYMKAPVTKFATGGTYSFSKARKEMLLGR